MFRVLFGSCQISKIVGSPPRSMTSLALRGCLGLKYHVFILVEQILSTVRELLVTIKARCHYCTLRAIVLCSLLWFMGIIHIGIASLLWRLTWPLLQPNDAMNASPQETGATQVSSSSGGLWALFLTCIVSSAMKTYPLLLRGQPRELTIACMFSESLGHLSPTTQRRVSLTWCWSFCQVIFGS